MIRTYLVPLNADALLGLDCCQISIPMLTNCEQLSRFCWYHYHQLLLERTPFCVLETRQLPICFKLKTQCFWINFPCLLVEFNMFAGQMPTRSATSLFLTASLRLILPFWQIHSSIFQLNAWLFFQFVLKHIRFCPDESISLCLSFSLPL